MVENTIRYEPIEVEIGFTRVPISVHPHNTRLMGEIVLLLKLTGIPKIFSDSLTLGHVTYFELVRDSDISLSLLWRDRLPPGASGRGDIVRWQRACCELLGQVDSAT